MKEEWTKEQLENFFRHETTMSDDACKKLAAKLIKSARFNLLIKQHPKDYTVQIE